MINGLDDTDRVTITVTLDKIYTGNVICDVKGPLGLFPKVLKFDNSSEYSFSFHSNKFGYYEFPAGRIKEFQNVTSMKLAVTFD